MKRILLVLAALIAGGMWWWSAPKADPPSPPQWESDADWADRDAQEQFMCEIGYIQC